MISKNTLIYQLIALPGRELMRGIEFLFRKASGDYVFFNTAQYPWTTQIEANYKTIQAELLNLLENKQRIPNFHEISEDQEAITDGIWKSFMFYACGHKIESNCNKCPETAKLLANIPGMKNSLFSILEPGTHLKPHRGIFCGFGRYHLGLVVPNNVDQCGIRVEETTKSWEEGKSFMFDDTYEHEAWNHTDQIRVILMVDVARKLPLPLSLVNELMIWLIGISPFVQNMLEKQANFDRQAT